MLIFRKSKKEKLKIRQGPNFDYWSTYVERLRHNYCLQQRLWEDNVFIGMCLK